MRYGPGRRPLVDASRNVKFAPLRCEWRDDPQVKRVRLQQEPHKPTALSLPLSRAHAWAPCDEPVRKSSSGKLRIAFPPGIAASRVLSARRPQHGIKPAAVDDSAVLNAQATAGLLMIKWDPSSGMQGMSPAPPAPETPGMPSRDDVHVDGPCANAHQSHTTASADATAAAMPQPPTPKPAATPSPPSLQGQVVPSCVLPQPTVPLQAALAARDASSRPDTFYHPTSIAQCAVLPVALDPVEARRKKKIGVSSAPRTVPECTSSRRAPLPSQNHGPRA